MKKYLLFFSLLFLFFFLFPKKEIFSQSPNNVPFPTSTPNSIHIAATPTPTPTESITPTPISSDSQAWVPDAEVTFVGKVGARSGKFLDWALNSYPWASASVDLQNFWLIILKIVYAFSILFVLITAFIMIITRGRSITIMRFIQRFILIIILITFSFALIQFIYQIGDAIQGFFFVVRDSQGNQHIINQSDLLYVGWDYETFNGLRLPGSQFDESAFISLLLVKLTAVTYYAMTGVLLLRKVILWFFIIISPIFPLLLLYSPLRNTGKIWIGEFFRWLLYAPIFAVFLSGVVALWRAGSDKIPGIPLNFGASVGRGDELINGIGEAGTKVIYPTAVNILLGGPGQQLSIANSVNLPQTFALYVVALLMLWVVILLPFLLLQIFLDYLHNISFGEVSFIKQMMNKSYPFLNKYGLAGSPPSPTSPPAPLQPAGAGLARALPFSNKMEIPNIRANDIANQSQISNTLSNAQRMLSQRLAEENKEILRLTNLSVPTMRDIARFETSSMSSDIKRHEETAKMHETLEKISNPRLVGAPSERENFIKIRENLVQAKQKGNPVAVSILSAAGHVSQKATGVKLPQTVAFPATNRVQSVSLDDYESVKKMWAENYQKLGVPKAINGLEKGREEWIKEEIEVITQTINYLMSNNQPKLQQGMDNVSRILPFLLIGGFSHDEVVAYLKAKLEAAKTVLSDLDKQKEEEETSVETKKKAEEKPKAMHEQAEASLNDENEKKEENLKDSLADLEAMDNKEEPIKEAEVKENS